MANQRIYLRCNVCGECRFLAKRSGGAFHTIGDKLQERLDRFFEKHFVCYPVAFPKGASGNRRAREQAAMAALPKNWPDIFSIRYESELTPEDTLDPEGS